MKTVTYDDALWSLVPVEPTEKMIVEGFESEPNDYFTDQNELERYNALSGCRQAAYRASKCWSAMLRAAPTPPAVEQAVHDVLSDVVTQGIGIMRIDPTDIYQSSAKQRSMQAAIDAARKE